MELLDRSQRERLITSHPGWRLSGEVITRTFVFTSFAEAIGFVVAVGIASEKANHHPDIDIRYRRVTVSLTTHDQGGLTGKDTSLASRIDRLAS